ncbi:MAG: hypothetical protein H0U09_09620, partial [Geodermatophilaceae bacterium]|nr:hypothetical protein [Geodermatophilaceae bacterium]
PRYLTPTVSTLWMGALSIIFYVGLTLVSENVLQDSILAVGLMEIYARIAPAFFRGETLKRRSSDLLLAGRNGPTFGLPDSREGTVIAPDLSNLPPGQRPHGGDEQPR